MSAGAEDPRELGHYYFDDFDKTSGDYPLNVAASDDDVSWPDSPGWVRAEAYVIDHTPRNGQEWNALGEPLVDWLDRRLADMEHNLSSRALREQRDRVALLREAVTLALGLIDGTSERPVHDLIIIRAILEDTAPPKQQVEDTAP